MNKQLIDAVVSQIGDRDSLVDVARHGADLGFNGYIYYSETVDFFDRNKALILALVGDMSDEFGLSRIDFVKGFNCLDQDDEDEIGEVIYGNGDSASIKNALAWFALEEVARHENPNV